MQPIFWFSIALIVYCYFLYPLLIAVWAMFFSKPVRKRLIEPTVSILIAAHNEEDVLLGKIKNLFSVDYPKEKIEILVGSDGSDDHTVQLLNGISDFRLTVFAFDERRGKMSVINDLALKARGEILLFTDARQTFAQNTIKQLVSNFADNTIGCVSGELVFTEDNEDATAKGVSLYWKYEKFIRRQESQAHSMLGATGAIYAIRKHYFVPLPSDIILDDIYLPFTIIQRGLRAIFDNSAKAYDKVAENPVEENRRKVRTISGNYQLFTKFPGMFIPFKSPIAVQLFSHKLLRLTVPFLMIIVLVLNICLINITLYKTIFYLQIFFYLLAIIGYLARNNDYGMLKLILKVAYVPYVFCLLNYSALMGFFRFIRADQKVTWQKARS